MEQMVFSGFFLALVSIPLFAGYLFTLLPIFMVVGLLGYFIFSWLFGYVKLAFDTEDKKLRQPLRRYFEPEIIYFDGVEESDPARSA